MQSLYQQHYHKHDILATMAVEKGWYRVGVTIPCDAYIDRRELERSTCYNEFLKKTGSGGLTRAETRVLELPITDRSPREIAESLGTRTQTVRSQLKSIFLKTGVHGQRELLALVARLPNVEVQQAPGKAQD